MKIKTVIGFSIAAAVVVAIFLLGLPKAEIVPIDNPSEETLVRIDVQPPAVDFGDIKKNGGIISTTVQIKNTGTESISLNRLSTSCGCTSAEMDMEDLLPDETRDMTITFDPMTHPDQTGPIVRVVYLQTSDPNAKEIEIDVTGNVIDENSTESL